MTVLRESPWYQEILEEGLEKGRQEGLKLGLEQGLERGLERGLEQGLEQGVEQGLRQGAQRQLVRVIEHQFGSVPPDVPARLRDLSVAQLEALVEIALDADSLEEFLDHLATDRDNGRPAA